MTFHHARLASGLEVIEFGQTPTQISRALRDYDDALRLVPGIDEKHGCEVWRVLRYNGPDREADFVCGWWDDYGVPLPLSSALLDKVKLLDRNTRSSQPSVDEKNAALREEKRRDGERELQAVADDYRAKLDRHRISVSVSIGKEG